MLLSFARKTVGKSRFGEGLVNGKIQCLNTGNISPFRMFKPDAVVSIKVTKDKDVRR